MSIKYECSIRSAPIEYLVEKMKSLSTEHSSLDLSGYSVFERSCDEIMQFIDAIPPHVAHLDLSENNFSHTNTKLLIDILLKLPRNLSSLDLEGNQLACKSSDDLIKIVKSLPSSLINLNLSNNDFEKDLSKVLLVLPEKLKSLNLSDNNFRFMSTLELMYTFKSIPKSVNALNLGWFTSKYWKRISISFNLFRITTNAEFLSTTTESNLSPKRGIGSESDKMRP